MHPLPPSSGALVVFARRVYSLVWAIAVGLLSSGAGCYHYVPSQPADLSPAGLDETRVRVKSSAGPIELEDAKYQAPTLAGTVYSIARPTPGFEVNHRVTLSIADASAIEVRRLNKGATGVLVAGSIVAGVLIAVPLILLGIGFGSGLGQL